jgi:hypothetical protein
MTSGVLTVSRRLSRQLFTAVLSAACLSVPAFVAAQEKPPSLADVARKEMERRKTVKAPAKVYTEKDVKPAPAPAAGGHGAPATGAPAQAGEAANDGPKPGDKPAAEPGGEPKGEAWWRSRITTAREELRRSEAFEEALQSRINGLTADFQSRDDPAQRGRVAQERQKALAERERVRSEIESAKQKIATIEEEARVAGVPPGWLR